MKTSTKNEFSKKMAKYGALSIAIAGVADASGQVVYTDLNPDESLTAPADFLIDLNNDGTDDFWLRVVTAQGGGYAALALPADGVSYNSNAIVGLSSGGYLYPSNLSASVTVDAASPMISGGRGDMNWKSCGYPGSQWCGGVTDGYLGLVLKLGGDTHYGWARLDLTADASSMTIKDFAYQSTPNTAIMTGEGLGIDDAKIAGFDYFYSTQENRLSLSADEPFSNINLYNILGQKVLSQGLSNTKENISLSSLNSGVYLANVNVNGKVATFKIVKR